MVKITKKVILALVITILVILNFYVYYRYFTGPKFKNVQQKISGIVNKNPSNSPVKVVPTPKPTPKWIYPEKETYNISGGKPNEPIITKIVLDPQDPKVGSTQLIDVYISYPKAISEVSAEVTDDKGKNIIKGQLISGTNTNGVWQIKRDVKNEEKYKYQITINGISENIKRVVDLVLR